MLKDKLRIIRENKATYIALGSNQIGDEGAQAIAEALQGNTSITSIYFVGREIGDAGAKAIAGALKGTSITSLSLGNNKIGNVGAQAIAEALPYTSITSLHLWNNEIGDAGAKAIAGALPYTSITSLHLWNNEIGDEGARAIAGAIKDNTSITYLDVWNNKIGNVGARAIAEAIPHSNLLKYNDVKTELYHKLEAIINNSASSDVKYTDILNNDGAKVIFEKGPAISEMLREERFQGEKYNKIKYLAEHHEFIEGLRAVTPLLLTAKTCQTESEECLSGDIMGIVTCSLVGVEGNKLDFLKFVGEVSPVSDILH